MVPLVFVDADVLYSTTLRGWLFNLAHGKSLNVPSFELVVTEDVIAETVAKWRDGHPTAPGGVLTTLSNNLRTLCTVLEDYDCEMDFPGDDDGDIHVFAAAVTAKVGYLVTKDNGFHDLPSEVKDELEFEIYHPDDFFLLVDAQNHSNVLEATRENMRHHLSRGQDDLGMVEMLRRNECPKFADIVEQHLIVLTGTAAITANAARAR
ncbi:hypothetical protein LJR044_003158 [Microbacterium foliorum]